MLTNELKDKLASQLNSWKGFIEASFLRMCRDLSSRFDDEDLISELYVVGHGLMEQGFDPEIDAALFKRAYLNRIRDLIDYHKAACRNYHRDLSVNARPAAPAEEDHGFDQFATDALAFSDVQFSSDIPVIDQYSDEGTPEEMTSIRDIISTIRTRLGEGDSCSMFDAITSVSPSLLAEWEARKATAKVEGKVVRTDGRTPLGLPWQIWAEHLGWTVARVKKSMQEVRIVTFRILGRETVFGSGVSTYAHMQLPQEVL
jgi:hypothetical protein